MSCTSTTRPILSMDKNGGLFPEDYMEFGLPVPAATVPGFQITERTPRQDARVKPLDLEPLPTPVEGTIPIDEQETTNRAGFLASCAVLVVGAVLFAASAGALLGGLM